MEKAAPPEAREKLRIGPKDWALKLCDLVHIEGFGGYEVKDLGFERVLEVLPANLGITQSMLRLPTEDSESWRTNWLRVRVHLESLANSIAKECRGQLHLFIQAGYALSMSIGQVLGDRAGSPPVVIHYLGGRGKSSRLDYVESDSHITSEEPFFSHSNPSLDNTSKPGPTFHLIAIQGRQPLDHRGPVLKLSQGLPLPFGSFYRPEDPTLPVEKFAQAVDELHQGIHQYQATHPHIAGYYLITTATNNLLLEVARRLNRRVVQPVIVCEYHSGERRYAPMVDIMSGKPVDDPWVLPGDSGKSIRIDESIVDGRDIIEDDALIDTSSKELTHSKSQDLKTSKPTLSIEQLSDFAAAFGIRPDTADVTRRGNAPIEGTSKDLARSESQNLKTSKPTLSIEQLSDFAAIFGITPAALEEKQDSTALGDENPDDLESVEIRTLDDEESDGLTAQDTPSIDDEAPKDDDPNIPVTRYSRPGGKHPRLPTLSNIPTLDDEDPDDLESVGIPSLDDELPQEPELQDVSKEASKQPPPPEVKIPPRRDSMAILQSVLGDQPAEVDTLGFDDYVKALSNFLKDENTKGPLTISVEGPWGSGKSSFLLQLRKELGKSAKDKKLPSKPIKAVTFNAWRHQKAESLWASFALTLMDQLRPKRLFPRVWASAKLTWKRISGGRTSRFRFGVGILALLSALGIWLFGLSALLFEQSPWVRSILNQLIGSDAKSAVTVFAKGGGALGLTALAAQFSYWAFKELIDPLRGHLSALVSAPDYEALIPFIDTFHKDVADILKAYVGDERVYVFVEDLDRCTPPRSADLIEAINQMLGENSQVIFILAMDRQTVASAMAVKHKDIVPFLSPSAGDSPEDKRLAHLRYGYRYVEKFIQLPFTLPMANTDRIPGLWAHKPAKKDGKIKEDHKEEGQIASLKGLPQGAPPLQLSEGLKAPPEQDSPPISEGNSPSQPRQEIEEDRTNSAEPIEGTKDEPREDSVEVVASAPALSDNDPNSTDSSDQIQLLKVQIAPDGAHLGRYFALVEPAIGDNPRRIKRWVNLFRLRVYTFGQLERLSLGSPKRGSDLTLEKLAKLVAIEIRWPLLLQEAVKDPELLSDLQHDPTEGDPRHDRWLQTPGLIDVLSAFPEEGIGMRKGQRSRYYDVGSLDLRAVLRIAPPTEASPGSETTPPLDNPL